MAPGNSPCASCKLLRRRCAKDCIFAPYFSSDEPHKFAIVHKIFGASNVSKMLQELPVCQRADAVSSLVYEANARMRDPVYGCVGAISYLQSQVSQLQMQLAMAQADMLCIQMQQESPVLSANGVLPGHPGYSNNMLTEDGVSSDDMSYSRMHNSNTIINHHHHHHHQHQEQYLNFTCNNVIQYDTLKRESSSLWA
ncbi:unnamed protein product [Lactuca saligna]|uniref:LOB domain-containing protein n=1 Tax=Lactuca saligna TaxID=75948 RepID=A0AA35YGX8_LACSI|nr:unnamed protein product [Lactuca saligna]